MIKIYYEDSDILVVEKPAGLDSQAGRGFEPDMVSEIKNYLKLSTKPSTRNKEKGGEPYVGVIHRLDKPVGGIMVYAKNPKSAASLSRQVQDGRMRKKYQAVVCGKPVDIVDNYVDYLLRDGKRNRSSVVDKETAGSKCARLRYRVIWSRDVQGERPDGLPLTISLVEIELLTGRHHQIRVQFAAHGTPLFGDARYNPLWGGALPSDGREKKEQGILTGSKRRGRLALCSVCLAFEHPATGKAMEFTHKTVDAIFEGPGGGAERTLCPEDRRFRITGY